MHRLLELFSGTGSIGKAFLREGWEVISVDIDKKANPTHLANVLTWDYRQYPPGYFDFVWASPPCTQYSIARTCAQTPRDLEGSDRIVERTQEIISYFDCLWAMENPFTGLLKSRPCMAGMDRYLKVVSYCKYGMPYRKNTAIWSNLGEYWFPKPLCNKFSVCELRADGATRHPCVAQQRLGKGGNPRYSTRQLYVIPASLCDEIAKAVCETVRAEPGTQKPNF